MMNNVIGYSVVAFIGALIAVIFFLSKTKKNEMIFGRIAAFTIASGIAGVVMSLAEVHSTKVLIFSIVAGMGAIPVFGWYVCRRLESIPTSTVWNEPTCK
jgi:hypothetical protein